jgi:sulfite reductase (ferredoxin)
MSSSETPSPAVAASTPAAKETKAQHAERLKREKNPWAAWEDILGFARDGRASVTPEWASTYFKWWGLYTQGDGQGATGGKGGQGVVSDYFMMRIGIPNGVLTAAQLRAIGGLCRKHARNLADITVRQCIQFHWLAIESVPEVIETLKSVGLSPIGACGDVVRNVTGCPLAGVAHDELIDAAPIAAAISKRLSGNNDFFNLPRKFKVSVTGCPSWCSHPEINDVALTAVAHEGQVGFSLRVGGGLSKEPHIAVKLDAFVLPEQAVRVTEAICEIFRDQQGLRESRERARLKYLFLKEGWTAESFLAELQSRLEFRLLPAVPEVVPDDVVRDHTGIHAQKQAGLFTVGVSVLRGRLTGEQLEAAAALAERYGSGALRTTISQNLLFLDIPAAKTAELTAELGKLELRVEGTPFWRGSVSCTGTEFCKLAITETKGFTRWLVEELEERLPEFDQQLRINVTGCSNSCGQHWIADIGIEGKKIRQGAEMVDAYYFCLGGAVGKHAAVARPVGYRVAATEVPESIERLLRQYLAERLAGENLRAWFGRHSNDALRGFLAGEAVAAVERDLPPGPVPHGVAE